MKTYRPNPAYCAEADRPCSPCRSDFMRQLLRLIRYVRPYWWQLSASVIFMAGVGLLTAFRIALVRPILDRVFRLAAALHPALAGKDQAPFFHGCSDLKPISKLRSARIPMRRGRAWGCPLNGLEISS